MKKIRAYLFLSAGFVSGMMVHICIARWAMRPTEVGGEVLIVPMMVLLWVVGYQLGRMKEE